MAGDGPSVVGGGWSVDRQSVAADGRSVAGGGWSLGGQ